jgi:hypothetical protein
MKLKVTFKFEAGETTCAVEPGKFCKFCRADIRGNGECVLFRVKLLDEDGWIQRCSFCLEEAVEVVAVTK